MNPRRIKNTKAKGRQREAKTMRRLEQIGYRCTCSAASLGEWDVVAIGPNDVRLVQVKSNAWPGSVEREGMELFPAPLNAVKEIWRWDDHAREPRVQVWESGRWVERRAHWGAEELGL